MNLTDRFRQAVSRIEQLSKRPSNEELLMLYALYKQATEGDVKGDRPGGFDFKAIAKYDAWAAHRNKSPDQAMQEYIELVDKLCQQYA
jgi:acyl-CoA-binding protein